MSVDNNDAFSIGLIIANTSNLFFSTNIFWRIDNYY